MKRGTFGCISSNVEINSGYSIYDVFNFYIGPKKFKNDSLPDIGFAGACERRYLASLVSIQRIRQEAEGNDSGNRWCRQGTNWWPWPWPLAKRLNQLRPEVCLTYITSRNSKLYHGILLISWKNTLKCEKVVIKLTNVINT